MSNGNQIILWQRKVALCQYSTLYMSNVLHIGEKLHFSADQLIHTASCVKGLKLKMVSNCFDCELN